MSCLYLVNRKICVYHRIIGRPHDIVVLCPNGGWPLASSWQEVVSHVWQLFEYLLLRVPLGARRADWVTIQPDGFQELFSASYLSSSKQVLHCHLLMCVCVCVFPAVF